MKKPAKKSPKKASAKKAPAKARVAASKTSSKAVGGRRPKQRAVPTQSRAITPPAGEQVAAGPGTRDGRGSKDNVP